MARIVVEDGERFLANVPEQYVFWCRDGRTFQSLQELVDAFDTMSEETFKFHVTPEKNDFSNWIKDVIGDEKLASDLHRAKNQSQAARLVRTRINSLTRKARPSKR